MVHLILADREGLVVVEVLMEAITHQEDLELPVHQDKDMMVLVVMEQAG